MALTGIGRPLIAFVFFIGLACNAVYGSPIEKRSDVTIEDDESKSPYIIHLGVNVLPGPDEKGPEYAIPLEPTEKGKEGGEPPEPIASENEPKCIVMSANDVLGYQGAGCNMTEIEENCYTNPICSDTCTAEDGSEKDRDAPLWPEQNSTKMCECVVPRAILYSVPLPPPGARDWPPSRHCRPNGCTFPNNDTLIQPGAKFELNGSPCICAEGPSPYLMDYAFLYHIACNMTVSFEDTSSASNEDTTASDEATLTSDEATPTPDEATPASDESIPASDESIPASDESIPTSDESIPTSDESIPASDESIPASDEDAEDETTEETEEAVEVADRK